MDAVARASEIVDAEADRLSWHPTLMRARLRSFLYRLRGWWAALAPTDRRLIVQEGALLLATLLAALIDRQHRRS